MRIETLDPARPDPARTVVRELAVAPGGPHLAARGSDARGAADLLHSLVAGFGAADGDRLEDAALALDTVPGGVADALEGLLGDGWVALTLRGADGASTRMEETSFAGVWRVHRHPVSASPATRSVEIGALPGLVVPTLARLTRTPPAAAGAPTDRLRVLFADIARRASKVRADSAVHVVNLTLAGLDDEELAVLTDRLGTGPVSGVCLGFSTTRFASTAVQNVWRVRYFDQAERLVLDTLELVQVPECAVAQASEVRRSIHRLTELARTLPDVAG